jgi:hypothetical protein
MRWSQPRAVPMFSFMSIFHTLFVATHALARGGSACSREMLKRSVTITILCVVACACMRQRDQSDAERYIIESERQWAESVATGDASVVERILADDFVGVDPKGRLYDKATMVSDTRDAPNYFVSNRANEIKVRFYGDTAVAQGSETWERGSGEPVIRYAVALSGQTPG